MSRFDRDDELWKRNGVVGVVDDVEEDDDNDEDVNESLLVDSPQIAHVIC